MNRELLGVMSIQDYVPSENEEYMNKKHLEYFSEKLQLMLNELEQQALIEDSDNEKLAKRRTDKKEKIQEALEKITDGTYGYCDETGEEIGIGRLEANPLALYCIEEQERIEREKSMYNIDD
ncbi:TraR/DksA C4-type zinc finger protein [Wolbachia endosymbiont of Pentalonia nigronervosa]|jgi:DnaK suppressor protein|uniref:TraR/DksA family transcriptional regulator n=1 Tax=Wolbachia endosymbiont of Pentalonia nigronervosa TaxID=1301914 RepID=UPI00165EFA76|nr:TraR/DksA C4-type zinc finger protein [Wolbachia endosymbiont of Pentalonia nigronervosa]MBD0391605.1 TraR/DksA C4-type zinc finger protein [Wolbachia endosymbiont of Pentalonia nigronervosa]